MKQKRKKKQESIRHMPAHAFPEAVTPMSVAFERYTPRRETQTLPGFKADASLYRTTVDYRSSGRAVRTRCRHAATAPHLFCRPIDCPCQKAARVRGGGIVVPSYQLPCYFTCERR